MLSEFAPAKVNLCLHGTGLRHDGYHLLDSIAVLADVGDTLSAAPADGLSLEIGGPFGEGLSAGPDNLVLRAARLLATQFDRPRGARLLLDKRLPVASGIGGGSADAAAALRLLVRLWQAPPAIVAKLPALALELGADVPMCLAGQPARMRGIGERLDPVEMPACGLLLVNPGDAVATASVFRARTGDYGRPLTMAAWPDVTALAAWLGAAGNDLQTAAEALCPAITEVLAEIVQLPACLLARMSGSGATCFGLFATPETARLASKRIVHEGWWCWGGGLAARSGFGAEHQPCFSPST